MGTHFGSKRQVFFLVCLSLSKIAAFRFTTLASRILIYYFYTLPESELASIRSQTLGNIIARNLPGFVGIEQAPLFVPFRTCSLTEWAVFSPCSVTCDGGVQVFL
jgi:hypothetical protein